jgi:hypothetical protein
VGCYGVGVWHTYMSQRGLVPDGLRALEQGTEGAHHLHLTGGVTGEWAL